MKAKEFFYLLGIKPRAKTYGYKVKEFELSCDGTVLFSQWLHPKEREKVISQESVSNLRKYLCAGDVAIDIGAHSGDTTVPMALAVGKSGLVLALEPNRYVFPVLKKNSELNSDKTNIIALPIAATRSDGKVALEYSDAGFCDGGIHKGISKWRHGHAFKLIVEGRNLEALLREEYSHLIPRIRFIKIDTEGHDCTIIKSIAGIIEECKPYIKAEVYKHTSIAERVDLFESISKHGYRIHRVSDNNEYTGELITPENLSTWQHYDIFCVPDTTQGYTGGVKR